MTEILAFLAGVWVGIVFMAWLFQYEILPVLRRWRR